MLRVVNTVSRLIQVTELKPVLQINLLDMIRPIIRLRVLTTLHQSMINGSVANYLQAKELMMLAILFKYPVAQEFRTVILLIKDLLMVRELLLIQEPVNQIPI